MDEPLCKPNALLRSPPVRPRDATQWSRFGGRAAFVGIARDSAEGGSRFLLTISRAAERSLLFRTHRTTYRVFRGDITVTAAATTKMAEWEPSELLGLKAYHC